MDYPIVYVVAIAVLSGCRGTNGVQNVYQTSQDYFRNPDRGFYVHTETKSSNFVPLTVQGLEDIRDEQTSLVLRLYVLDSFVTSNISTQFLTNLGTDLSRVKDAGLSCILRFCYANTDAAPRDASKAWVLQHIQSLAPTLNQYSDVISALQAGFIGVWGEWYLSDNFGTPWTNTGYLGLTNQHWADRSEVVHALVDDITQIPILIRTPYYKIKVLDTSVAATFSDVTSGNYKGRLGHHNDCFLRTPSDMGTYYIETVERAYLEDETLVLPNGGETCGLSTVDVSSSTLTDRSKCPTALQELGDYHFSFLNRNYHPDVLQSWVDDGCWEQVKTRLGYSLRLTESDLPDTVSAGGILAYSITVTNAGWAAPYRPYTVRLVLKSTTFGVYYSAELNDDPRTWSAGDDHVIQGSVKVNPSTAAGEYKMYLAIVQTGLQTRADYFILLENTDVPQPASGLNSLLHIVTVSGSDQTTSTSPTLESWTLTSQFGSRGL